MPTSGAALWYCDYVVLGPVPYLLMLLPLLGAFYYGRHKKTLGKQLIGAWVAIQIPMSYVNYVVMHCPGDNGMLEEMKQENEASQASQPPEPVQGK